MVRRHWSSLVVGLLAACSSAPQTEAPPPSAPPPPIGQFVPLSEEEAAKVVARLAPLSQPAQSQPDFYLRKDSLPPPRPGKTLEVAFPAPTSLPTPKVEESGPLQVLRHAPEGEVSQAPNISITFSQPMSTLGEEIALTPEQVPVKLTPQPEGQWRWLGARTLIFEHGDQIPQATQYTLVVPAGTRSANGSALEKEETFSFATPPPYIESAYPYNGEVSVELTPMISLRFNQKVDPAKVLAGVKSTPANTFTISSQESTRDVYLTPTKPFPKNTRVTITLAAGVYSAEGPRPMANPYSFSFNTYGPLRMVQALCSYERGVPCYPEDGWRFTFSNPIDSSKFDPKMITVTPSVEDLHCDAYGELNCYGSFKGDTRYTVSLSSEITDEFEQKLGSSASASFSIGPREKTLYGPDSDFIVLEPAAKPTVTVQSVNYSGLKVDLYQVSTNDYDSYLQTRYYFFDSSEPTTPPGKLISSKKIPIKTRNEEVKTEIDLTEALVGGLGQVLVVVSPTDPPVKDEYGDVYFDHLELWVQSTKMSFDTILDQEDAFVFVQDLVSGAPIEGAEVELYPTGVKTVTQKDGMAYLALPDTVGQRWIVRKGGEEIFSPQLSTNWYGAQRRVAPQESLRWFVFNDRGMFRPGEEVNLKGWIRNVRSGKRADVLGLMPYKIITYVLYDSRNNEISKGDLKVNNFGGFDALLKLPDTMNLGYARLELSTGLFTKSSYSYSFRVEEFRRPEYEVTAKASEGTRFIKDAAEVTVSARYYAGGSLPDAPVVWDIRASEAYFTPPNQDTFTFGDQVFSWWHKRPLPTLPELLAATSSQPTSQPLPPQTVTEGFTAVDGEHTVKLTLPAVEPPRPYNIYAQATVQDLNNQSWSANASILVHPADRYVGLRTEKGFAQKGEPVVLQAIVTDLDGKEISNHPIRLSVAHVTEQYKDGVWKEAFDDQQSYDLVSAAKPIEQIFTPQKSGTYQITAEITDTQGRKNLTTFSLWVAGDDELTDRSLSAEEVRLFADKKEYKPGETAELLVLSPIYPAEGLLVVNHGGVIEHQRFTMNSATTSLKIEIKETFSPEVSFEVLTVGAKKRRNKAASQEATLPPQPAFAEGALSVSVPTVGRTLLVTATPKSKELAPGKKTEVEVIVKDAEGKPVKDAEVVLVVVDESVLALSGYQIPDPIATFYPALGSMLSKLHHRTWVQLAKEDELAPALPPPPPRPQEPKEPTLANPFSNDKKEEEKSLNGSGYGAGQGMPSPAPSADPAKPMAPKAKPKMAMKKAAPGGKSGGGGSYEAAASTESSAPLTMRTNLDPLAIFSASTTTNKKGRVVIKFTMPDNLTRYRVTALVADNNKRFGVAESAITASRPLMVRPSPPRFLNLGDQILLPVLVQNTGDKPLLTKVVLRAQDQVSIESFGFLAHVPANDRLEVRFPVRAKGVGEVKFQVAAVSGKWTDAQEFDFPIYTPATTEAQATYGVIDEGAISQPVKLPDNASTLFGGIEVTTSSTALSTLTDAVLYLIRYPYECAEQLSSRVLAVAALRDVLTAFDAEGLPPAPLINATVAIDLKLLSERQNYDGGFGFWRKGDESWPYLSLHVAHAVARAKAKGYQIPENLLYGITSYLPTVEYLPLRDYSQATKDMLLAYSLYVRHLLGTGDPARARKLFADRGVDGLPLESLGWLLVAMSPDTASATDIETIKTHLNTRVAETADEAHFTTDYGRDYGYLVLASDRRTDAILLEALITVDPKSDLIPKLVVGLTKNRVAGRWGNTQENAFVLLALDKYFNTYENITPDFVAKIWLGETYAGEQPFKGRSPDRKKLSIPMAELAKTPKTSLLLQKEGEGRLYYRIGLRYAPEDLILQPASYGFTVSREYEAVDNPEDVKKQLDGTWKIKAGARVRVKLTMIAPTRRYHVALVDPLPAGLEAQNASFATTRNNAGSSGSGTVGYGKGKSHRRYDYWWYRWYQYENQRDERVEAFSSLLWEGTYSYEYTALATTPGTFIVPPTKAEEMYSPETFGRSGTDTVIVEPAANQL